MALTLSIVVPAYNEERTIAAVLEQVRAVDLGPLGVDKEIIVVSDGSSDATVALARAQPGVEVIEYHPNRGKGAAVREGIRAATGQIVLIQDADLEYEPRDYLNLLPPLLEERARVVYGSRILGFERDFGGRFVRRHDGAYRSAYLGGRLVTMATNLLYGSRLTDEPTCYKCFRADVIKGIVIEHDGFDWEPEVTAKVLRMGIDIVEVPIAYHPRTFAEGKKIRFSDGVSAFMTLARYRHWRP
jgi:dolichol-phosphate mannosyltransferase